MKSVVWVVGAGDEDKDLVPSMLVDGVMIIGPSRSTGDLDKVNLTKLSGLGRNDKSALKCIKNRIKLNQIVVLRLGSVCFAVGSIKSDYKFNPKYSSVKSYWNKGSLSPAEKSWSMEHVREVDWFILNDPEAIHFFRKGIYGSAMRLYRLGSGGKKPSKTAKSELDTYLIKKGYDGINANDILKLIGKLTTGVNSFGFPK